MFHPPSLLFPGGHFETTFPTLTTTTFLPNCSRPESAGQAHFRTGGEEFAYPADPTHSTGQEPKVFDKITSADGDTTPINDPNYGNISVFSKITRENTGLFGVSTMLEASVSHVSHGEFPLKKKRKDSMHRETIAGQTKKKEEREGSVISVAESMSKKSQWKSTWSHSLQTHRDLYSDERYLRKDLERRAQQAILGEKFRSEKLYLTECDLEIQNSERRNFRRLSSYSRSSLSSTSRSKDQSQYFR